MSRRVLVRVRLLLALAGRVVRAIGEWLACLIAALFVIGLIWAVCLGYALFAIFWVGPQGIFRPQRKRRDK